MQFQRKGLPFCFFPFKRPLLQNCIMHSSICTNGYFFSYYIDIHVWNAAGETCFVSKRYDLPGQASLTACPLWPMYFFSHVWPKMLQLLLDGQDDKQIYIIFFIIYKLPTKEKKNNNPLESWTFHQMIWGGRQRINKKQSWTIAEWWLLALILLIPSLFFFMFFPAS